jgi:hypothetical protein
MSKKHGRTLATIPRSTTQTSPALATCGILCFHTVEKSEALGGSMFQRCDLLGFIHRERPAAQQPAFLVREARQLVEDFS